MPDPRIPFNPISQDPETIQNWTVTFNVRGTHENVIVAKSAAFDVMTPIVGVSGATIDFDHYTRIAADIGASFMDLP